LRGHDIAFLREHFGSLADYLYRAARAIDLRAVKPNRPRKSLGGERTFDRDISTGPGLRQVLEGIIEMVWDDITKAQAQGRTVTPAAPVRFRSAPMRAHWTGLWRGGMNLPRSGGNC
jgi:DNA polymerase-4